MYMLDKIRARRDEIYAVARRHKAERLWVFGSCARREERADSDVDFIVKFQQGTTYADRLNFKLEISDVLERPTDVISTMQLMCQPRLARQVLRERVAI